MGQRRDAAGPLVTHCVVSYAVRTQSVTSERQLPHARRQSIICMVSYTSGIAQNIQLSRAALIHWLSLHQSGCFVAEKSSSGIVGDILRRNMRFLCHLMCNDIFQGILLTGES